MTAIRDWNMLVVGCGTANLAAVRALGGSAAAASLRWAGAIDPATIRDLNALTCPEFAGHQRKPKVERMGDLIEGWFPLDRVHRFPSTLEAVDWGRLWQGPRERCVADGPVVALIGLDDWGSRLRLIERLRHAAPVRPEILPVQIAVDRDEAQVTVLGNRWEDRCPACGIFPLPGSEPCVLLRDRHLVRGDLQREARAAGELVAEVVGDYLAAGSASPWIGTKTNLFAKPRGSSQFHRETHARTKVPGCMGPHDPATPLRLGDLLAHETIQPASGTESGSHRDMLARALAVVRASRGAAPEREARRALERTAAS